MRVSPRVAPLHPLHPPCPKARTYTGTAPQHHPTLCWNLIAPSSSRSKLLLVLVPTYVGTAPAPPPFFLYPNTRAPSLPHTPPGPTNTASSSAVACLRACLGLGAAPQTKKARSLAGGQLAHPHPRPTAPPGLPHPQHTSPHLPTPPHTSPHPHGGGPPLGTTGQGCTGGPPSHPQPSVL
jgi:hypothetical protein